MMGRRFLHRTTPDSGTFRAFGFAVNTGLVGLLDHRWMMRQDASCRETVQSVTATLPVMAWDRLRFFIF